MKKSLLLLPLVFFMCTIIFSSEFTYVGSQKCRFCHRGKSKGNVYEKWQNGPHNISYQSLVREGGQGSPECLECHTTGYNKGGFVWRADDSEKFAHVGCESCHGPGSAYRKSSIMKDRANAIANGLVIPDENLCKTCHNERSKDFIGFDYQEFLKKIDHTYREK
jgi:hypothetical protein